MSPPRTHPGGTRRPGGRAVTTLTIKTLEEPLARIRSIKPNFFTSLTIADLSLTARITFIGLWTHVDDDGRAVDDARLVKAAVWPLDDRTAADVERDLEELATVARSDGGRGLIMRYEVGGRRYLCVTNWREHQRIDKPTRSKLPAPPAPPAPSGPDGGGKTPLAEDSGNAPGGLSEDSRPEGNREQGREGEQGEEKTSVPAVGGLTDRNARATTQAPPAQPERSPRPVTSLTARSLIAEIPRYRDPAVKPWFRRHLIEMADAALAAGFGREAIAHYAQLVIGASQFADHQHIPEFRDALRRLALDVRTGHACPVCARDPGGTWCCVTEDRMWTADDQAALERALDALRPTPNELAKEA